MIHGTLQDIIAHQKKVQKTIKKSKKAQKAVAKAHRKLRKALKSQNLQEVKILLGMAQVAISKAEVIATTRGAF